MVEKNKDNFIMYATNLKNIEFIIKSGLISDIDNIDTIKDIEKFIDTLYYYKDLENLRLLRFNLINIKYNDYNKRYVLVKNIDYLDIKSSTEEETRITKLFDLNLFQLYNLQNRKRNLEFFAAKSILIWKPILEYKRRKV